MASSSFRCLMLAVFVFLIEADDMVNVRELDDRFLREKEARASQLTMPEGLSRSLSSNDWSAIRHEMYMILNKIMRSKPSNPVHREYTKRGGALYTRWGRTTCPSGSKLVYAGWVGGSWWQHPGSASNPLCLPRDPIYANYTSKVEFHAMIYGGEYFTHNRLPNFHNQAHDVPCAVCQSSTKTNSMMLPARTECYPGWNREYFGYLMAGWHNQKAASQYVCVDHQPESDLGGIEDKRGYLFHFVEGICGSLHCPPYKKGYEITCAVCTK